MMHGGGLRLHIELLLAYLINNSLSMSTNITKLELLVPVKAMNGARHDFIIV